MGLGPEWSCLFANDNDPKKAASYARNWGDAEIRLADVAELTPAHLPGVADLAWASFPCQDLSLAGYGAGLRGERFRRLLAFLESHEVVCESRIVRRRSSFWRTCAAP